MTSRSKFLGQYRKAAQALTSAGLAQDCPATVAALRELHPQCERAMPCSEEPSAPPLQFTSDQVIQAVKSFQAGTAPGPSGLRAQHLKDLTSGRNMAPHIAANIIKALTKVVNLFASGKAASGAAEYCAGANLFAANKKDGGMHKTNCSGGCIETSGLKMFCLLPF